jgi:hypothetical protein
MAMGKKKRKKKKKKKSILFFKFIFFSPAPQSTGGTRTQTRSVP